MTSVTERVFRVFQGCVVKIEEGSPMVHVPCMDAEGRVPVAAVEALAETGAGVLVETGALAEAGAGALTEAGAGVERSVRRVRFDGDAGAPGAQGRGEILPVAATQQRLGIAGEPGKSRKPGRMHFRSFGIGGIVDVKEPQALRDGRIDPIEPTGLRHSLASLGGVVLLGVRA
jgi:hypothetical protein